MYEEWASRYDGAVLWTREARGDGAAAEVYPVLPDGCMDLLWVGGSLLVAGPDTHAYRPEGLGDRRIAGIRFAPGTAPALLGVPAYELRDQRVPLAELWSGVRVRRLTARAPKLSAALEQGGAPFAARDPAAALEAVALELAADAGPPDPAVAYAARALGAGHGVARTADALGLSARQLHRRSLAAFGYGPKTLARVLRLQRALALARSGVSFAGTAAAAGFADQAHLARDVRDLTDLALGELLSRRP